MSEEPRFPLSKEIYDIVKAMKDEERTISNVKKKLEEKNLQASDSLINRIIRKVRSEEKVTVEPVAPKPPLVTPPPPETKPLEVELSEVEFAVKTTFNTIFSITGLRSLTDDEAKLLAKSYHALIIKYAPYLAAYAVEITAAFSTIIIVGPRIIEKMKKEEKKKEEEEKKSEGSKEKTV